VRFVSLAKGYRLTRPDRGRVYIVYWPTRENPIVPFHRLQQQTTGERGIHDFQLSVRGLALPAHGRQGPRREGEVCGHCRCGEYRQDATENQDVPLTLPHIR